MTPKQQRLLVPIDTYVRTALSQAEAIHCDLDVDDESQQTRYAMAAICGDLRSALARIEAVAKGEE